MAFDFKGHALEEQRQLYEDETAQPDWTDLLGEDTIAEMATAAASLLDAETFSASSERDALGRVLTAVSPDGSEVHYLYDEGGALQQVTLHHRGSETEQTVVGDITYDAKGRREEVVYGPTGDPTSTTTYTYDELSQRLTRLRTVRESDSEAIQSLHYHYDPVGNITDIRDTAQQTVYFDNAVVSAANSYTYDALYRLVEATGREHSSEGTTQRTHADMTATAQPMTSDPSAMRLYAQQFVYDEVGNILEMKHLPSSGAGWTRYYQYDEDGNRLLATSASGDDPEGPYTHEYEHDAHGNMVEMPHLSSMIWNHDDELQEVTAGSETVYFQYAGGNRMRKYVEKPGSVTEERIYLGNFEIYRKRISGDIDIERESLHVSDGTGRILLIETKTIDEGDPVTTPTGIWRYQLSNHIGSASTEITEDGDIISYEEYHPYGTTAYRAVDSSIDVSAKRYRYTGMERDEETGLSYHTARYYASWLGRWTASDPIGLEGGGNRFAYSLANPIVFSDVGGRAPCYGGGGDIDEGQDCEPEEPDVLEVEGDIVDIQVDAPDTTVAEAIDHYRGHHGELGYMLESKIWTDEEKRQIVQGVIGGAVTGGADISAGEQMIDAYTGYLGQTLDNTAGRWWDWAWGAVDSSIYSGLQEVDRMILSGAEGRLGEEALMMGAELGVALGEAPATAVTTHRDVAAAALEGDVEEADRRYREGVEATYKTLVLIAAAWRLGTGIAGGKGGGKNRRGEIERGVNGARKHQPGHRKEAIRRQEQKDRNERQAAKKMSAEAKQAQLENEWANLDPQVQKILYDNDMEKFIRSEWKKRGW